MKKLKKLIIKILCYLVKLLNSIIFFVAIGLITIYMIAVNLKTIFLIFTKRFETVVRR